MDTLPRHKQSEYISFTDLIKTFRLQIKAIQTFYPHINKQKHTEKKQWNKIIIIITTPQVFFNHIQKLSEEYIQPHHIICIFINISCENFRLFRLLNTRS